jgi:spore germination protein KC
MSWILLAGISLTMTGCWDSKELDKLSIGDAIGFDLDTETQEYILTDQYIIPQQVKNGGKDGSGSSGGGAGEITPAVQISQSRGKFWLEARENNSVKSSRAQFSHAITLFVIGQEVARQELYRFMEHILRIPQSRMSSYLVLAEGKASDILYARTGMESLPGIGFGGIVDISSQFSLYPEVRIIDFGKSMMSETTAPVMPIVGIFHENTMDGKEVKKLYIKGLAVFKDNKLVGELNQTEAKGLLWVTGKERRGVVTTNLPDGEQITLQVIRAKSKIRPQIAEGKITIDLTVKEQAGLREYSGQQNIDAALIQQMEEVQAQAIKKEITSALNKSRALNADIFGFGEAVHRKFKKDWPDIASRWDEIYPHMEVNVQVETEIIEIGDTRKAIIPQKNKEQE